MPKAPLLALLAAVPAVGAAKGAVKRFQERLRQSNPPSRPLDRPLAQLALGRADMDVATAELVVRDTARELEQLAARSHLAHVEERIRMRARLAYATELSRNSLRTLHDVSGSSAHHLSNPSQRALRDVTMISTHAVLELGTSMELLGRVMAGLPSNNHLV
jgi:3-hydroxy-9,10-secoandrosta-1,3,5(10)-triene-9,17-dione monooxygenase